VEKAVALVDRFALDHVVESLPILHAARRHAAPLLTLWRYDFRRRWIVALRIRTGPQLRELRSGLLRIRGCDAYPHVHVECGRVPDLKSRDFGGRFLPRAEHKVFGRPARILQRVLQTV